MTTLTGGFVGQLWVPSPNHLGPANSILHHPRRGASSILRTFRDLEEFDSDSGLGSDDDIEPPRSESDWGESSAMSYLTIHSGSFMDSLTVPTSTAPAPPTPESSQPMSVGSGGGSTPASSTCVSPASSMLSDQSAVAALPCDDSTRSGAVAASSRRSLGDGKRPMC